MWNIFENLWSRFYDLAAWFWWASGKIREDFSWFPFGAADWLAGGVHWLGDLSNAISRGMLWLYQWLSEIDLEGFFANFVWSLKTFIGYYWSKVSYFFTVCYDKANWFFTSIWDWVMWFFTWARDSINWLLAQAWDQISLFFTWAQDKINWLLGQAWDRITWFFTTMWDWFMWFFTWANDKINWLLGQAWDRINWLLTEAWPWICSTFTALWDRISSTFTTLWDRINFVFTTVWDRITPFFTDPAGFIWAYITQEFDNRVKDTLERLLANFADWVVLQAEKVLERVW